jgi:signal transduction histidine kinase
VDEWSSTSPQVTEPWPDEHGGVAVAECAAARHPADAVRLGYQERLWPCAEQALLQERARITRELHDVLAHHLLVIAVQADAALAGIPDLPEAARRTFEVVREATRGALAETRQVIGLPQSGDERPPGLDRLGELVHTARRNGLRVCTSVVGTPRPLRAHVDLAAYRIVQESLSNAARHAPGARVTVTISYGSETLRVSVADDGAHTAVNAPSGGGQGLVGMHERVTLLGGTLKAGPTEENGWSVDIGLPYGEHGPV